MPGFDGTGPRGMGPFTGRGMGYCAVPVSGTVPAGGYYEPFNRGTPTYYGSPYPNPYAYAYRPQYLFRGRGRGFSGRGRGRGRGRW